MRRFRKYRKPNYSRPTKLILIAVLVLLTAVLGYIIMLEARQIKLERAGQSPAQQTAQPVQTPTEGETDADAAAQEAEQAQAAQQRAEEARAARVEEGKKYSFYQKLAHGCDVNMLVMGDSVISGEGASGDDTTWIAQLKAYVEDKYLSGGDYTGTMSVTNLAAEGSTVVKGYFTAMELDDGVDYDLAVLCFARDDADKDYGVYFEALVRAIHYRYPDCAVISVLEATEGGHTNKMMSMETVCKYYDIPVADTFAAHYALGEKDFFTAFSDSIHPNDKGQTIYFETIRDIIDENVENDTGKMADTAALSGEAARFDRLTYVSAADFTRDGTEFSLSQEFTGVLILDCTYPIVKENARLVADDILYNLPKDAPFDGPRGNYLLIASKEMVITDKMSITFTDDTLAAGFSGVYLCSSAPEEASAS